MSGASVLPDLTPLLPEGIVAVGLLAVLSSDLAAGARVRHLGAWLGMGACIAAGMAALTTAGGDVGDMLAVDAVDRLARPLILSLTGLVLLAGAGDRRGETDHGAWSACVLGVGLGAMLVAAAANLVTLWLGLELVSLSSYVLAAWRGGDRQAAEAGMKFVLFGGAASGVMLFGMSHVYGLTGRLDFPGIGAAMADGMPAAVAATLLLAGTGIAYKLTIAPFHFYAPDVYQGAPALSIAAVGAVPKIAAGAVLLRAIDLVLPPSLVSPPARAGAFAVAAMCSLLLAAFTALAQRDAKRIIAFSGIGHAGTLLLAFACLPWPEAGAAAGVYLLAYAVANLGALVCLSVLERELGSCALAALPGALQRRPGVTVALCVFLGSLAGVPPLAGFLGKWAVLQQSLRHGIGPGGVPLLGWGSFTLLLSTAISAWSYLLIVRAAVLEPAPATVRSPAAPLPLPTAVVLLLCSVATVALGLWLDATTAIARALAP